MPREPLEVDDLFARGGEPRERLGLPRSGQTGQDDEMHDDLVHK
jgi:hypothetical protein